MLENSNSGLDSGINSGQVISKKENYSNKISSSVKICMTYPYSNEQFLFKYRKKDKTLLQIEKKGYQIPGCPSRLEKEYKITYDNDSIKFHKVIKEIKIQSSS